MLKALIANPVAHHRNSNGGHFSSAAFSRSFIEEIYTPGTGIKLPPEGAVAMRIAVIGGGGCCNGGGGGAAATKIIQPESINYKIGAGGINEYLKNNRNTGEDSYATLKNYHLLASGGDGDGQFIEYGSYKHYRIFHGGKGSGGDYNYVGGTGTINHPNYGNITGGSAGSRSNGAGLNTSNSVISPGWGPTGGKNGGSTNDCKKGTGGGGAGSDKHNNVRSGGIPGGAASMLCEIFDSSHGGSGGLIIEWFYK